MIRSLFRSFGFSIRENVVFLLFSNVFTSVFLLGAFLLPIVVPGSNELKLTLLVATLFVGTQIYATMARFALEMTEYRKPSFGDFGKFWLKSWVDGIVQFVFVAMMFIVCFNSIPYYASQNNAFAWFSIAFLVALTSWGVLAFQFYLSFRCLEGDKVFASLKKCFAFLLDNVVFVVSIGALVLAMNVLAIASAIFNPFTAILVASIPGFVGTMTFLQTALKLRLKKYDWLEDHPDFSGKKLPWDEILAEDEEKLRTERAKRNVPRLR